MENKKYNILLISIVFLMPFAVLSQEKQDTKKSFELNFTFGSTTINLDIFENRATLDSLLVFIEESKKDTLLTIKKIEINGYASPEGSVSLNKKISQKRAESMSEYLLNKCGLIDTNIIIRSHGIAWEELAKKIKSSTVPYKSEALELIETIPEETWAKVNPNDSWLTLIDSRNKRLMDLRGGVPYRDMSREIYPKLRTNSVVVFYYEYKPQIQIKERESITYIAPIIEQTKDKPIDSLQQEQRISKPPIEPVIKDSKPLLVLKTNLLFDAATILNAELEIPIKNRWSIAGEVMFPWWVTKDNGNALQVMAVNIEGKYWFGSQEIRDSRLVMTGWFAGLYMGGGYYDLQYRNNGYQGELFIAGLSGGYAHTINKSGSLRMEYSLAIGYLQTNYRYYEGMNNNEFLVWQHDGRYTWFGPTKAKVSLVWLLNSKKR